MRSAPSPPSHTAHPLSYTHQVRPFSSIPSAQACSLRPSPSPLPDTPGRRLGSSCPPVAMVTRSVPGAAWRAGAGQPRNARTGGLPGDQGSLCPAVVELCDLAGMEAPGARLGPPVSRDRVIADFPKALRPPVFQWYTPEACLQLKDHFHGQVRAACRERRTGTVGLKVSKVVVLGDLYVGKTSLINRFCKDVFDRHYKATIGVDFEIERFEIAGVPYSLQIWDTAGQEKFKCIASAYYRGAQVIITAFDLADIKTLGHTSGWQTPKGRTSRVPAPSSWLGQRRICWPARRSPPVRARLRAHRDGRRAAGQRDAGRVLVGFGQNRGEREGLLHPGCRPGVRAVRAAGTGEERQPARPDWGRGLHQHRNGGALYCGRCQR
ncbi:ras-related protein Rab-36 isoform X13 [Sminthopsis crassicaudata]|uniref:ras-related protein Rab-36 isoform X13 n=1 Tax=Sminthopsis crassicaudata TaxID=9301 RepID=UPI003D6886E7